MAATSCGSAVTAQPGPGLPRPASSGPASSRPTGLADQPIHPGQAGDRIRVRRVRTLAVRDQFAGCEQRIKLAPRPRPTVAIVGASYTAGVGPDNPMLSWAVDLVRKLHWDSVIYGLPGAGYVRTGSGDLGPMARMLTDERLTALSPTLVLIQAGYDDGRVPVGIEGQQVRRTVELIRAEAPQATIGLITVFTSPARPIPARFYRIDSAIVAAAKAADPQAIIMDPLTGDWKYQHADDGLHPTAAGDAWIARKVEAVLQAHGVDSHPAITAAAAPIICDVGIRTTASGGDAGI
jgi:lysophospholipase L1-like esterase